MQIKNILPVILLAFAASAYGVDYIDCDFEDAPSSDAQGGVYTCDTGSMSLWFGSNQSGTVHEHTTTEGWGDSGAVKFWTMTSGTDTYRQLVPSSVGTTTVQHNRYLVKYSAASIAYADGKWNLAEPTTGTWRTWLSHPVRACSVGGINAPEVAYNGTLSMMHGGGYEGPCEGYQWCANDSTWYDAGNLDSCTIHETTIFDWDDYADEWVAIEVGRTSAGVYRLYIWTEDGAFNGLYYTIDTAFTDNPTTPPVGGYIEDPGSTEYAFWIDEVIYSDAYIGPPAGFGDASEPILYAPVLTLLP